MTDPVERDSIERALAYMDLEAGTPITEIEIDRVFIGSCTNGRIEDLRAAAAVLSGNTISDRVTGLVVPGSGLVKEQAEAEGLDKIFVEAGLEWREAGCSMCLAMNPDRLEPGERAASTSNRNFEGRQGTGRTHPSRLTGDGSCCSHSWPLRRCQQGERMNPVSTISGTAAPLPRANIDTDQIIPKQFLKRVERSGFGEFLFFDWKADHEGEIDPDFVLNKPQYSRRRDPRDGTELRLGILTGTRPVGS